MQGAALMGVVDGAGHGRHQPGGGAGAQDEAAPLLGQAAAFDELHAEVLLALVLADLVDRHDPGVVEQRDGLGLVLKSARFGVIG